MSRPLVSAVAAAVTTVAAVAVPAGGLLSSFPPTTTTPAVVETSSQLATPVLALSGLSHLVVGPGTELSLSVLVSNTSERPLASGLIDVGVGWRRLGSRDDLSSWVQGSSQRTVTQVATESVGSLAPGASRLVDVVVDIDRLHLDGGARGPRPLSVSLRDAGELSGAVLRSFLLWDPGSGYDVTDSLASLAFAAPLTGPAFDLDSDLLPQLEPLVASTGRLDAAVQSLAAINAAATGSQAVAAAVDPAVMAVAAASDDQAVLQWLSRVAALTRGGQTSPLPPFDPDLVALSRADLSPQDLVDAVTVPLPSPPSDTGSHVNNSNSTGSASNSAGTTSDDDSRWTVPDTWASPLAWLPEGAILTPDALHSVTASGLSSLVIPASSLVPSASSSSVSVSTEAGLVTALIPDGTLSPLIAQLTQAPTAGLDGSIESPSPSSDGTQQQPGLVLDTELLVRAAAETSLIADGFSRDKPILIALPRSWHPDPARVSALLDALTGTGWVSLASATPSAPAASDVTDFSSLPLLTDTAAATTATTTALTPSGLSVPSGSTLPPSTVRTLADARTSVARLASVTDEPSSIFGPLSAALALPVAVAWRDVTSPSMATQPGALTEGDRSNLANAALHQSRMLSESLSATAAGVTLISDEGSLPISVRNDLPAQATVTIELDPRDPRLVVDDRPTVTLDPQSSQTVYVPVRAIASGDVTIGIYVLTRDGQHTGASATLDLRVRAGWETAGTAVAAVILLLLLVAGIVRTIRRGRSDSRQGADGLTDPALRVP
ncbi:MAG: DUF6049 family protein [Cellulomonadaceae bacterium]|jgi:hypothetical protein|nr:DUF6049 family protein [Cellulomonadaceae bacterium]